MSEEMIKRINELARIKKEIGLTPEQEQEQKQLYRQYIEYIKGGVRAALDKAQAQKQALPVPAAIPIVNIAINPSATRRAC